MANATENQKEDKEIRVYTNSHVLAFSNGTDVFILSFFSFVFLLPHDERC